MIQKSKNNDSITMKAVAFFCSIIPIKKNKEKKDVADENLKASRSKPSLVTLLDAKEARRSDSDPDGLYDAIADAIVKNIIEDSKDRNSNNFDFIEDFLAEAETKYTQKQEEEIHRNRVFIKDRLKKDIYNGSLLMEDQKKLSAKNKKGKKR